MCDNGNGCKKTLIIKDCAGPDGVFCCNPELFYYICCGDIVANAGITGGACDKTCGPQPPMRIAMRDATVGVYAAKLKILTLSTCGDTGGK